MTKYNRLIYQFLTLVMSCEFMFQGPYWLYVIWQRICRRPGLALCCYQLPCVLFSTNSGSTLLSSTSPQPCLPLPLPLLLFLLPRPLVGLVIWIMKEFYKRNQNLLQTLANFFHYPKELYHFFGNCREPSQILL